MAPPLCGGTRGRVWVSDTRLLRRGAPGGGVSALRCALRRPRLHCAVHRVREAALRRELREAEEHGSEVRGEEGREDAQVLDAGGAREAATAQERRRFLGP